MAGEYRLAGAHVLNAGTGSFTRADVLVEGERVTGVEPGTQRPASATDIDCTGRFLLAGLIDCHVHLTMRGEDPDPAANSTRSDDEIRDYARTAAERTLSGGVTTVRDLGGWNYVEMDVQHEIDSGKRDGVRTVLAGRLISLPTPAVRYYPGMYEVARTADEVAAAVRAQLRNGAEVIKVMATGAMLSPEEERAEEAQLAGPEIYAAVEASAAEGKPVAAHAHALAGIRNAVEAGVASIEHGTFADEELLKQMASRGVFLVPTIAASASLMNDARVVAEMPDHLRARLLESHETHLEMIRLARRIGVPIAMGTDAGTPGNYHGDNVMECVYMVHEAGLTPAEAIRAATVNAATLLGREDSIGAIEPGKLADIVGCSGNPLDDITELTRISLVMKGGTVLKSGGGRR